MRAMPWILKLGYLYDPNDYPNPTVVPYHARCWPMVCQPIELSAIELSPIELPPIERNRGEPATISSSASPPVLRGL
jgi:hypothetical protein